MTQSPAWLEEIEKRLNAIAAWTPEKPNGAYADLIDHAPEDIARLIGALKVATDALESMPRLVGGIENSKADPQSIAQAALAKIRDGK